MIKHRAFTAIGALLLALVLAGCDAGPVRQLLSFAGGTATPTKTPRPTFTPPPTSTPTPIIPISTDTPVPTAPATSAPAPATATKKPAAPTARPATRAPTAPPPTAVPSFAITLSNQYFCEQPGGSFYEIIGRINRSSGEFVGGNALAVFSTDGRMLGTPREAVPDGSQVTAPWFNCRAEKWYSYNTKMDVTEFRTQFPLLVRIVRSVSDPTPISAAFKADFATSGRYFLEYRSP